MSDVDDLSARARRQPLSAVDARAFADSLEASPDARLWHRVGTAFDAEDSVLPGDHDAAERVLGRLLGELPVKKPRTRRRLGVLLVAAAVLIASAAAATVAGIRQREKAAQTSHRNETTLRASGAPPKAGVALQTPPEPHAQPVDQSVDQPPLAPAAPTASGECVSWMTSHARATFCIHVPDTDTIWPEKKRR